MVKRSHSIKRVFFYLFVVLYFLLLAKALLFKYVSPLALLSGERTITRALNLVPFKTINDYFAANANVWIASMNVFGNILLFIPLGIYVQAFKKNKAILPSVAIVCVVSICVELTQYVLGIGAADIDDVILNAIGGGMGVLLYRLLFAVLKDEGKVDTAIVLLWCIVIALCLALMCYLTYYLGLKIRIF